MTPAVTRACAVVLGVVWLAAAGCDDDRPPPPRPMEGRGSSAQATGRPVGPESEPDPVTRGRDLGGSGGGGGAGGGGRAEGGEQGDDGPALEAALREAIAGAQGCLPTDDPSLPDMVTVRATVHLSATGRITRASASSAELPAEAMDCVETRLEARSLPAPPPDGSRSASASYSWRFERHEPEPRDEGSAETTEPSQGYGVEGPSGVTIQPTEGQSPSGPSGVTIQPTEGQSPSGPSGQPIEGPSGTPIGE